MQRYHAPNCTSAVNNSAIGGASARDTARADASSLPPNFSVNPRRQSQLTAYKLKCEKELLNSRLGPPDFHAQNQNCPEETLTRENVQHGYKDTIDGIEDNKEISLTQVQAFTQPVVLKCRDAIRKCLRAINESRAQKRKAGQVYGVPLSGSLLCKPGVFPEQRPRVEDFWKKSIEGSSQQHKRLRSLADNIPHGYRRKSLFEVLIRTNVPLLRATWFIKVTYLNQVRPGTSGVADKTQLSCIELWTKDVIEYLQHLLNEFYTRNHSHSNTQSRDRPPQMLYAGSLQQKSDPTSAVFDGEEPSLHFKWWYVVRLLQWHHAEGLLLPSPIIDWVLSQLQEKELLEILQLLLPIIHGVLEAITLSQTYVRALVGLAIRFIREPSPGGSDLVDNSRRAYTISALVEMLRYLIQAVPDTFVAIDCFPLPPCVVSPASNDGNFVSKPSEDVGKINNNSAEVAYVFRSNGIDSQYQSLSLDHLVSTIQKRADNLAKRASNGYPSQGVAKAVQALDKSLLHGDLREAYKCIFEDFCDGDVDEGWVSEISSCLRSTLKWIGRVSPSFVCSVFFLCEWATCDFRDFRTGPPSDTNFTGRKDFSQVYVAIQLLKLKMRKLQNPPSQKNERSLAVKNLAKNNNRQNTYLGSTFVENDYEVKSNMKIMDGRISSADPFESPGPLHDIVVCWIDRHEGQKEESSMRIRLFVLELIRSGIFFPQAYVRQLIVSGIMDTTGSPADLVTRKRHYRILKQLPGPSMHNALEEARVAEGSELSETVQVYSNERRFVLHQLHHVSSKKQKRHSNTGKDCPSQTSGDQWKPVQPSSSTLSPMKVRRDVDLEELKASISALLQLPSSVCTSVDTGVDESQGCIKRPIELICNKMDLVEGTPGCEDCKRAKRQKLSEEKGSSLQVPSPSPSDDEDTWWVRKGPKSLESFKVDPPLKSTMKQVSRGRQKTVRKTQSLAQLAAARIEGSQGASTSHVCDTKTNCPHHRTELDTPKLLDGIRTLYAGDIVSIGRAIKQLRFVEKRNLTVWLISAVRQLVEETEKTLAKVGQYGRPFVNSDEKSPLRWKLGEDELSVILYLLDVSNDLASAVKFLLWLVPKVLNNPTPTIHSGRNILMMPRSVENHACGVGESFLLSSLRRYESIVVLTDLIPEVLSAIMNRAAAVMASTGRISSSTTIIYARYLLKRYGNIASVMAWDKNVKGKYDKRLLSELEAGRSLDGEFGFPPGGLAGVEDLDDYFRQKITGGRLSRVGFSMRDVVQRHLEEAFQYYFGKDRKLFATGTAKGPALEKWDDVNQIAQQIIMGLMDCIRQTGGAAQEGDPSLVSFAVSAIVSNVGPCMAKIPDFAAGSNCTNHQSSVSLLNFARRILRIHLTCLCLLKDALGERQSRVFEIALATESSSALAAVFGPGKSSRSQYQLSPEAHDSTANISNEILNTSAKAAVGRTTRSAAAVSALVIEAIIHGVTNLERMVTVLRLKEGLDIVQFVRSTKTNSNGSARSAGTFKVETSVEVHVHWFRLLVGNCRTVCDGLVAELVGEPSIVAISRMQRMLPINLVFPPAYAIFAFVIWKPFIMSSNFPGREDIHQLYLSLTRAVDDAIKHLPFRDACLRDSKGFYNIVAADSTDAEFAALLELNGLDLHLKTLAFVPLRARLFLNALIDCKMPNHLFQDDGIRASGQSEPKASHTESNSKLLDKLVHVLDTLQPAKLHWQWVELRLLLNEQAILEKMEHLDVSLVDAIRSSLSGSEKAADFENESNFVLIVLTRLLVRPDAASLFSEVVHLFGRSLEDSVLKQAKWFLAGQDVLYGRKTVRQRLINIAERKGLSTKPQFRRPWGWSYSNSNPASNPGEKKSEATSLEEGEVVQEGMESKRQVKGSAQMDAEGYNVTQQQVTEKAFIELVLPCIDQSSDDSRISLASELIKQLNLIEQHISSVMRGLNKQTGTTSSGIEGSGNKGNNRKGIRGGSPGLARQQTGAADSAPPCPAALRASMSLRLQFVLRLLPIIFADGEPSVRNMRHMLASVILRLLGSRVVYEDVDLYFNPTPLKEGELMMESSAASAGESLFDHLLLVLHGLLSSCPPSWLRSKPSVKSTIEFSKDVSGFDPDVAESLQNDLDRMQLPEMIRWRIQAAMPKLFPSVRYFISCQPSSVPVAALSLLQPSFSPGFCPGNLISPQRPVPLARTTNSAAGKSKQMPLSQDFDSEIDPWTLLEDGAGSGPSSGNSVVLASSDHANFRACSWLKGTVRVRRTDLTYIGAIDDDS